jgi:hypothetical protein
LHLLNTLCFQSHHKTVLICFYLPSAFFLSIAFIFFS